jgi:hypothetical protein
MMLLHKQIFVRLTQVSEIIVTLLQLKTKVATGHVFTQEKPIHFNSWSKKHYKEHNSSKMVTLYCTKQNFIKFIFYNTLYITYSGSAILHFKQHATVFYLSKVTIRKFH